MSSALYMTPKVPFEYVIDNNKVHFKYPQLTDKRATFMIILTWAIDTKNNKRIHFQFVPVVCEECLRK